MLLFQAKRSHPLSRFYDIIVKTSSILITTIIITTVLTPDPLLVSSNARPKYAAPPSPWSKPSWIRDNGRVIYFLRNEQPSVSLALPPVGWHSTVEQPWQMTTVWACEKTVVMLKQPGHLTSIKKERGAGTRVYASETMLAHISRLTVESGKYCDRGCHHVWQKARSAKELC